MKIYHDPATHFTLVTTDQGARFYQDTGSMTPLARLKLALEKIALGSRNVYRRHPFLEITAAEAGLPIDKPTDIEGPALDALKLEGKDPPCDP